MKYNCDLCDIEDKCILKDNVRICTNCQSKLCVNKCKNKDKLNKDNIPYCALCINLSEFKNE